jgi:hypothetical protein
MAKPQAKEGTKGGSGTAAGVLFGRLAFYDAYIGDTETGWRDLDSLFGDYGDSPFFAAKVKVDN